MRKGCDIHQTAFAHFHNSQPAVYYPWIMRGSKVVTIRRADQSYVIASIIGISRSVAGLLYEVRVDDRIDEDAVDGVIHMAGPKNQSNPHQ